MGGLVFVFVGFGGFIFLRQSCPYRRKSSSGSSVAWALPPFHLVVGVGSPFRSELTAECGEGFTGFAEELPRVCRRQCRRNPPKTPAAFGAGASVSNQTEIDLKPGRTETIAHRLKSGYQADVGGWGDEFPHPAMFYLAAQRGCAVVRITTSLKVESVADWQASP